MSRNEAWSPGSEPKQNGTTHGLGHATPCFTGPNLPVYVRARRFSHREKVCVYDGPRARITFADKSHARFQFQRSIKPRYGMRGASFYFDLNDLRHAFCALNMPPPAKRVHISRLGCSSSKSFPAQESAMVQCSNLPFPKGFFRDSRRVECVSQSDKQIEDPYQLLTQRRSQL